MSLQQGLVGWWTMDDRDTQGGVLRDRSANDYHGSLNGGISIGNSAIIGQGYSFDGTDDYINAAPSGAIPDDQTISAWIKTTATGGGTSHYQTIGIVSQEAGGTADDFGFGVDSNGNLAYGNGDGSSDYTINGSAVNDGNWHHCVATRDKSSGDMALYIDGSLDATGTGSTTSLVDADYQIDIGRSNDSAALRYFTGSITSVRIYRRVLADAEIAALAEQRIPRHLHG